jgi:hypothetical protein
VSLILVSRLEHCGQVSILAGYFSEADPVTSSELHKYTHSMDQSLSWEPNSRSAIEEIPRPSWKSKGHWRVHNNSLVQAVCDQELFAVYPSSPREKKTLSICSQRLLTHACADILISGGTVLHMQPEDSPCPFEWLENNVLNFNSLYVIFTCSECSFCVIV